MKLRTKFIVFIALIVAVSYGVTFYRTSDFQRELVLSQAARQARMLSKQVLMTRKWIADHNGLFIMKAPGVEANPFLTKEAEIEDVAGRKFVKRNPAMVTRELSEYSSKEGFCRYRVTTLKPINPANAPDPWERKSLVNFERSALEEKVEVTLLGEQQVLRYIAPLYVEKSCLECHAHQGYKEGDIRGGLSVIIPMDWAFTGIEKNNRMLFFIAAATILVVGVALYLMVDLLMVRRMGSLARAMSRYPAEKEGVPQLEEAGDEVGQLAENFHELCRRLETSQQELVKTREQVYQSEKLAALGRLSAGVAHEVNNPLGGMLNCVKSMREAPGDATMQERYLGLMEGGLKRIGGIVQQLLKFGRREPLRFSMASVDELIKESSVLLEYGLKNVELKLDLGLPDEKYPIDSGALQQVIVNISLNAIQAMPEGGILRVHSWAAEKMLHIEIGDTGSGISEEHLSQIFDPFFTTKDVGKGTGLGLSVTYSLVARMGGIIEVESEEGVGTTFHISLPKSPEEQKTNGGEV